jgi:arabinofuranosyltransferase
LLLGGLLGLALLGFSRIYVIDDAYISFRYARHLVEGHGLVFNPGEYVEGYTSLLWTLLMALPEALHISVSSFAVSLGLVFGLLALFEVWRTCRLLGLSLWGTGAAMIGLGLYPEYWLTVTMGLEGGLFAFLLSHAVYLSVSKRWSWAGLYGGLLFATRPEALLLVFPFVAYLVFTAPNNGPSPRNHRSLVHQILSLLAPWLAVVAMVAAWRLIYYGAWLPNSVIAKSPPEYSLGILWPNFLHGAQYLAGFVLTSLLLALGSFSAVLLAWRKPVVWLCLGGLGAEAAAVLLNGGDWMPNHRLLAPYAPLLAILLGIAVSRASAIGWSGRLPSIALLAVGAACTLWSHDWEHGPDAHIVRADGCYGAIAKELAPQLYPSDVIAAGALGLPSYIDSQVYSHDELGLTDREIARNGPYYIPTLGKLDPMYTFYEISPTVYFTHGAAHDARWLEYLTDGEFTRRYSTYRLRGISLSKTPGCQGEKRQYIVSVRKGKAEGRLLSALKEFGPKAVSIPYRKGFVPWFQRG